MMSCLTVHFKTQITDVVIKELEMDPLKYIEEYVEKNFPFHSHKILKDGIQKNNVKALLIPSYSEPTINNTYSILLVWS